LIINYLKTDTTIQEDAYALSIVDLVGEFTHIEVVVVEASLLIASGLDILVVEQVVDTEVEVDLTKLGVDDLTDREVDHECIVETLLRSDFTHLLLEFLL
jgi:hypothetical protein